MEGSRRTGFRWYWFLGPEVLISVYGFVAIVVYRLWPYEPFAWRCLLIGAGMLGTTIGTYSQWIRRPGVVKAPPLFTLFWLLIIFLELMWVW